jgi:hypothetical protein
LTLTIESVDTVGSSAEAVEAAVPDTGSILDPALPAEAEAVAIPATARAPALALLVIAVAVATPDPGATLTVGL